MAEFVYSNVEKEMEVYGYDSVVKSHCRMCHGGCGVLVYTKDGKVAKIAGDPECPINHGTLCSKGIASAQLAYHPDRLTYPVRRIGPKGSGQWERISWDEALNAIAERILDYKDRFGAESIVMGELRNQRKDSSGEGYKEYLGRKLSETKAAKNLTDLPLLDLISHFPHTIGRLKDKGCESLLTDPMVIEIFESVFEVYENEGEIPATEILEKMDGDSARELFREVLLSPSMYKDDTVEQALKEFEKKALKIKLSESFLKAKDNLEEKNQLLMLKSKKIREQSL